MLSNVDIDNSGMCVCVLFERPCGIEAYLSLLTCLLTYLTSNHKERLQSNVRWSGVVVGVLALINEVNLRQLVLRWATVSGARHLFWYETKKPPRPTQPSIPPSAVNEYQLQLGRQRQVWFMPLADERGVCR